MDSTLQKLLDGFKRHHIRIVVGSLQMGHRLECIDLGYILISKHPLPEVGAHHQATPEPLAG